MKDGLENQDNELNTFTKEKDIVFQKKNNQKQHENAQGNAENICDEMSEDKFNEVTNYIDQDEESRQKQHKDDLVQVVPEDRTYLQNNFEKGSQNKDSKNDSENIGPADADIYSVNEQIPVNLEGTGNSNLDDPTKKNPATETLNENINEAEKNIVGEHEFIEINSNSEVSQNKSRKRSTEEPLFLEENEKKARLSPEVGVEENIEQHEFEEYNQENIPSFLLKCIDEYIERKLSVFTVMSNPVSKEIRKYLPVFDKLNELQKSLAEMKKSIYDLQLEVSEQKNKLTEDIITMRTTGRLVNEENANLSFVDYEESEQLFNKAKHNDSTFTIKTESIVKSKAELSVAKNTGSKGTVAKNTESKGTVAKNTDSKPTVAKNTESNPKPVYNSNKSIVKMKPRNSGPAESTVKVVKSSRPVNVIKTVAKTPPVAIQAMLNSNQTTVTPTKSVNFQNGHVIRRNSKLAQTSTALERHALNQLLSHPAPLPPAPPHPPSKDEWLAPPPKPVLKIMPCQNGPGTTLSWNAPLTDQHATIKSYQIYAYPETSDPPNMNTWKTVGDVKAMALPMACTLTQFKSDNKYYFSVRAIDEYKRMGPNSDPKPVDLTDSELKSE